MPQRLKVSLAVPEGDMQSYRNQIKQVMEEENIIAVRKWLKSVLAKTPTYTGTARGTFAPVGRVIGYAVRKGRIGGNPKGARRKKFFVYNGIRYPLGFGAGEQYQEHKIRVRAHKDWVIATFIFDQKLPYVIWNDARKAPAWLHLVRATPWRALKAGATSYQNHYRRHVYKRLGAVKLVINKKVVKSA